MFELKVYNKTRESKRKGEVERIKIQITREKNGQDNWREGLGEGRDNFVYQTRNKLKSDILDMICQPDTNMI